MFCCFVMSLNLCGISCVSAYAMQLVIKFFDIAKYRRQYCSRREIGIAFDVPTMDSRQMDNSCSLKFYSAIFENKNSDILDIGSFFFFSKKLF